MVPVLWHNRLICCLQYQHPAPAPVQVSAVQLPTQFSLLTAWESTDPSTWAPTTKWETQMKLLASAWPSLGCWGNLGSEPVDRRSLSPPNTLFQIKTNKYFLKYILKGFHLKIPLCNILKNTLTSFKCPLLVVKSQRKMPFLGVCLTEKDHI